MANTHNNSDQGPDQPMIQPLLDIIMDWLPTIPPKSVSDQQKGLRKRVTLNYGYATFIITIFVLLLLPYWTTLSKKVFFGIYGRIVRKIKFTRVRNNLFVLNLSVIKIISFWSAVLGCLSLLQTYSDLQFIAARVGRVATYCLPSVLFLTIRPSPLPHTLYLSLIPIHKWLSRIVVLQSALHTIFYIIIFADRNTMSKAIRKDNLYGIVAMTAFIIIFITSLPTIRRAWYNMFYINHYILTWVVVITLYFHVRPGIPYLTALNCFILVAQIAYRFWITKTTTIEATPVSSNMIIISFPNDSIALKSGLPGCHIRMIDFDQYNYFKQFLKNVFVPIQHPFTLATLPIDTSQKLIVRKGNFKLESSKKYLITGSFLPHLHFLKPIQKANPKSLMFRTNVRKCLIVVGGSAISFALPILRTLSYNGAMVKIIWVIRDHEDLKILDYFKNVLVNDDCIDIFITGGYSEDEQFNFRKAVDEMHRRKRALEINEQERMLSGDYSSSQEKLPKSPPLLDPRGKQPLSPSVNYGTLDDNEIDMNELFDSELGLQRLDDHHDKKHSYISLRHHQSGNGYSFAEERKFENVDLELGDGDNKNIKTCKSIGTLSTASAKTATSNDVNIFSPGVQVQSMTSPLLNMTSGSPQLYNSPGLGYSGSIEEPETMHSRTFSTPTRSSSYLYDDLADYWILKGLSCRIEFGRPKLGLFYYNWCIGSSCIGPLVELDTGKSVCCNEITKKARENPITGSTNNMYKKSNGKRFGQDAEDEMFLNDQFMKDRQERFATKGGELDESIWVIGAGPIGLVDKVRLWANDCGFHFHAESFSV